MKIEEIDPELKYCPDCHDEYRAEIEKCAGCGMVLMTGVQFIEAQSGGDQGRRLNRSMELSPDDELVGLKNGSLHDMKQIRVLLADEKIPSLLVSEDDSCGKGCCGTNVILQVRQEDVQDAIALLADKFKKDTVLSSYDLSHVNAVFDEKAENITCPACGHSFVPTTVTCPDCGLCFG